MSKNPTQRAEAGSNLFQEVELLKAQTQSIKKLTDKIVKSIAEVFAPAKNLRYGFHPSTEKNRKTLPKRLGNFTSDMLLTS